MFTINRKEHGYVDLNANKDETKSEKKRHIYLTILYIIICICILFIIKLLFNSSSSSSNYVLLSKEWNKRIKHSDMIWYDGTKENNNLNAEYFPNIGNGFLSYKLGPNKHFNDNNSTIGGLYLAGIYNGKETLSHRARLPSYHNVQLINNQDLKNQKNLIHLYIMVVA